MQQTDFTVKTSKHKSEQQNQKKNLTITAKQVVVAKIMYARMPEHNKKQNMTNNNCARRGSDTEANVQTTNTRKSE